MVPQPDPARNRPSPWEATADFGFTSSSGNTDLMALTSGFRLRHRKTSHFRFDWATNLRYGESSGDVIARHLRTKLNFDMGADVILAPFLSASVERDRFRKLDLRSKIGAGMRLAVRRAESGEASLRLAAQSSHERFTSTPVATARATSVFQDASGADVAATNWTPRIGTLAGSTPGPACGAGTVSAPPMPRQCRRSI